MSETSPRGRFVWYDLMTTDAAGAAAFYRQVAGWGTQVWEGSPTPYMMWTVQGTPIGGLMQLGSTAGAVPFWLGYVAVPDVDASAKQAEALGGKVLSAPRDIPEVGRFAVIADPQGAAIAIFTPRDAPPAPDGAPNVGEFSWHELTTTDHVKAYDFYQQLFGWEKTREFDMGEMGVYQVYGRGGQTLGGMWTKPKGDAAPTSWLYYIRVPNTDQAAARVTELGGQVVSGPMDVPSGDRVAQCLDPQGAAFAVQSSAG